MNKEFYFSRRAAELDLIGQILMTSVMTGGFNTKDVGLIEEKIKNEAEVAWKLYGWCFTYAGSPMGCFDPMHPDKVLIGLEHLEFIYTAKLLFAEEVEEFSEVVPDATWVGDDICGVLALIIHANHYNNYTTTSPWPL